MPLIQRYHAHSDLREVLQQANETENNFSIRLQEAVTECGHVYSSEITAIFIEGPLPPLGQLVLQARKDRSESSFVDIVAQARSRGDAMKAQEYIRAPKM